MKGHFAPSKIRSWLSGPMVAVATPFTEDFVLDLDALQQNIRFMIDRGVKTGQGALLVAAAGEVPVLSSIQHTDTRVIVELAQHASKMGIQGVQLNATYYYPATEADVLRLFKMVADASDVTIMIYRVGVLEEMGLEIIQRLAELETVRVLKFSSSNREEFTKSVTTLSKDLVIIDNSLQHVWAHMLGARGFITHISNFWPEYPLQIWELLEKGKYTTVKEKLALFKWKWAEWRSRVGEVTGGEGPFIKAAMEAVGLPAGPPRPPSARPPQELLHELRELLDLAGVPQARIGDERDG